MRAGGAGDPGGALAMAYPVIDGDSVLALAAAAVPRESAVSGRDRLLAQRMHWGAGWLSELLARREIATLKTRLERSSFLFELVTALGLASSLREAMGVLANRLAEFMQASALLVGRVQADHARVLAVAGSAHFEASSTQVRLAAAAMDEAVDQSATLGAPGAPADPLLVNACVLDYARLKGDGQVLVLPMPGEQGHSGALLLERPLPFEPGERRFLETLALTVGPLIELRARAEESLAARWRRQLRQALAYVLGPSHVGWKAVALLGLAVVALLAFWPVTHHVAARAVIEGEVQRAVVAPFEGYLREAPRRAGDTVRAGAVLARMDDKDLVLERTRWDAELELALRKEREALAAGERVARRLAQAQAEQARAQRDLAQEKLLRSRLIAPFDGVIVRGDLSQQIGSPLEAGKVLFELAPLDAWRMVLKVDERDIALLAAGRSGRLALASLPGTSWPLHITKVTSVASSEEGANVFRVEARLDESTAKLRPGMEGVARVQAGERSLLWVWTHRFVGWLDLQLWRLAP
ncbi:MAG TPA: HlyD family efflux transporter periplasmic adaptor subunit [Burkholderiaceae bacterium]|nr:HlyD family efflux transporter periplasmic adaptor subunit [Burkholderiaceae bacterium]